jgi:hypothetical protein
MSEFKSLRACLFEGFVDAGVRDPQDPDLIWAMQEGIARLNEYRREWRAIRARKAHTCIRGCAIHPQEIYFLQAWALGRDSDLKFCAACMAMILFYREVDQLPPAGFTHWAVDQAQPVREDFVLD